ncbi:BEACH domain [Trinorchestia longiramus]|nr:BEACH domain [Trinorchestia longiramus]
MEDTAPPDPRELPVQFVSGLELYQRLKPAHKLLAEKYDKLITTRRQFLSGMERVHAEAHAFACQTYVRTLLTFTQPAQGRLPSLLGRDCTEALSEDLLLDFLLQVAYFKTEISRRNPPAAAVEVSFLTTMTKYLQTYTQKVYAKTSNSPDVKSIFSTLVSHSFTNQHTSLEEALKESHERYEVAKNAKIQEMISRDGWMTRRREFMPETGVLICKTESTSAASDFSYVSHLQSFLPVYGEAYPTNVQDYIKQFGAEIIVALDKLENLGISSVKIEWLKIYMEIQSFIARTSDCATPPNIVRRDSCLTPNFFLDYENIFAVFTDSAVTRKNDVQCNSCNYLRDVNSTTAFYDYARNESSLELLTLAQVRDAGLDRNVYLYLESLVLKLVVSCTEEAIIYALDHRNASVDNPALKFLFESLKKIIQRLSGEGNQKWEGEAQGNSMLYCSLVKYFLLPVCVNLTEIPDGNFGEQYFTKMEAVLSQLCLLPMQSDRKAGETASFVTLTEKLAVGVLSVLRYFTSTKSHGEYLSLFCGAKLPVLMDAVLHHVSERVTAELAGLLKAIILNIKLKRGTVGGSGSECTSDLGFHHVGDELSVLFVDSCDPKVCQVSMFVSMLLSLYTCFDSEESTLVCIDELSQAGLCCCMTSHFVLEKLLSNLGSKKPVVVERTLDFIKQTVIETLNGLSLEKATDCFECQITRIGKAKEPPEDLRKDGIVLLELFTEKSSKLIELFDTNKVVRKLANINSLDYMDLKWAGLTHYKAALGTSLNPNFHDHFLYLARFGCQNIKHYVFEHIYRDFVERTLRTSFCTQSNLNKLENVYALSSSFSALTFLLLTKEDYKLTLGEPQWLAWKNIFYGNSKTRSLMLARASYGFGCALICCLVPNVTVPSAPQKPERYAECFQAVEEIVLAAQKAFLMALDDEYDSVTFPDILDRLLLTWSVLAELSCVPVFLQYLDHRFFKQGTSLLPLNLLSELLQVFKHRARFVLLKHRLNDTCSLIRCLLTVVAASRSLTDKRAAIVERIGSLLQIEETLLLPPLIVSRLFSTFLDVSYEALIKANSGLVDTVCGRTVDHPLSQDDKESTSESQEADLSSLSSTSEIYDILPQILHATTLAHDQTAEIIVFPELVPLMLETTIQYHHKVSRKLKTAHKLQDDKEISVEDAGIVAKAFGSLFGDAAQPATETKEQEELVKESDYTVAAYSNCLERVLEKTLFLCSESEVMETLSARDNMKELLLSGFSSLLKDSANYQGISSLVLKLWECLSSRILTAAELKQFLALFMGTSPPVDSLLRTLRKLLEKGVELPLTKLIFGPFTTDLLPDSLQPPTEAWAVYNEHGIRRQEKEPVPLNGVVSKATQLTDSERCFLERRGYTREFGCVNAGPTRCRLACVFSPTETNWTPVKDSTTAAFWCKLQSSRGSAEDINLSSLAGNEEDAIKIHFFSFGVKRLMVSTFLNSLTGACQVELLSYNSPDEPCVPVLDFQLDWRALLDGQWHFVTFSFPEHNTKKPATMTVESSIDGKLQTTQVHMKAFGSMKQDTLFVLLGNRNSIPKSSTNSEQDLTIKSYSITNFILLACPRLDELNILLLMAHGKDATNFLNWDKEETGDLLKKFLTHELVSSLKKKYATSPDKAVAEALGGLVHNALSSLLPTMLFHYNSETPESFLCYSRTSTSTHESHCSYNAAISRPCLVFDGPVESDDHQVAHHALLQLGGAPTLLRLLARVVELNSIEYSEIPRAVHSQDPGITYFGQADSSTFMPVEGHVDELSFSKPLDLECGPGTESGTGGANEPGLAEKTIGSSSSSSSVGCGASKSQAWCQAETVKIILWCIKHVPEIGKQFHAMNGKELLLRILYSPKMDTRLELLKALVEDCLSEPVLALDRVGAAASAVTNLPVHGVFRQPGPVMLIDPPLLAAILAHWHRVELKKLEMRKAASQSSDARMPERLVVDWCYGCCHSIDVLHRTVSLLTHPVHNSLCSFNAWQLHRVNALNLLLNMAQELLVQDWSEMQVMPRVLQATLHCFVPLQKDSELQLPNWPVGTVRELLNYLILRVEPCRALVWHSDSCTARLLKIYSLSSKLAESSKTQRIIRNILEIDLAEEVTKELTRQFPKLDSSVVAQEGKGLFTKEDQDRLSSTNSSFEAIDLDDSSEERAAAATAGLTLQIQNESRTASVTTSGGSPTSGLSTRESTRSTSVKIGKSFEASDETEPRGDQIVDTKRKLKIAASQDEQQTTSEAEGLEASNQTCASNESSAEEELASLKSGAGSIGHTLSGRSTPIFWPPTAVPSLKLDAADGHLITALHDFLLVQDETKFTHYISECVRPNHLALLANHGSVAVRAVVVKIFRQILCRRAPALRNLNSFKEHLMIVQHQFACKDSSEDLLEACLNLVISKPGHSVQSSDFVLMTDNLRSELKDPVMQNHILDTSAPLLAVLPKLDGQSFETVDRVLVFLATLVELGTCNRGRLLTMENLPESLLLTLQSFLKESRFRSVPVSNIVIDMCRSLLLGDDLLATKGLDLITKLFLLCENSNGKIRTAAVDILGRTLINSVVCLLRAMMVVSSKVLSKSLLALRIAKKRDKSLVAEETEHRSLALFADIKSEYEDYLMPVSPQLAIAIEAVDPNQTSFVSRTIKILKMTSNFLLKLDWVGCANSFNGALYHGLPLFVLDLHKKLLSTWDDFASHSGRVGFASTRHLPSHQFEVLSREYELEMRAALPELLCLLVTPSAPVSLFSDVLRKLARDPRTLRTILVYCRDRAYQLFAVMGHYLLKKGKKLQPGSQAFCDCDRVISVYESVGRSSRYREDARIANPESAMKDYLQRRLHLADEAVSMDVKTCVAAAVREHEDHRKKISNVYNKFLVIHANLKKRVLDEIARSDQSYHDMTMKWLQLGSDAFNDQSPWSGSAPSWWELLDYENSDKSRSLLGRTLLKVHPKFVMQEERAKASVDIPDDEDYHPELHQPLYSVLNDGSNLLHGNKASFFGCNSTESAVDIQITCKGWIVKPGIDWPGTIFVADGIYFRGVKTVCSYGKKLDVKVESSLYITPKEITKVRTGRYRLREVAFELHTSNRKSWLFVCDGEDDRNSIVEKLLFAANLPPQIPQEVALSEATKAWRNRRMSNFDYLMALNSIAGRTYNDLNQYPVFPYVLANYSAEVLDVSDPKYYRDLSKPMPAQTSDREHYFTERFEKSKDMSPHGLQFHYSSLYSNCVVVPNYLIRLPPFTLYFLHFQGGKFDEPTRTFKNLMQTYKNITEDTFGDFKEAIPEMYYLPEMFCNGERFDLRALSDGTLVDHVLLPKWCRGDRRLFVLCHRAALESSYVTENLPSWIDLIFGFKQTGDKAETAVNVYHPQGYPENLNTDPSRAWEEAIFMYGEVPRQLFSSVPHLKAAPVQHGDKVQMQLPHTTRLTALPIKGLQLLSFAFFPINNNAFYAEPGMNFIELEQNMGTVMSGDNTDVFHVAPRGALVVFDANGEAHVIHVCTADGVARVWSPGHIYPYPLFSLPSHAKVTCQTYEEGQVWLGTDCGLVLIYEVSLSAVQRRAFAAAKKQKNASVLQPQEEKSVYSLTCTSKHELAGTQCSVTALWASPRFNICVSGDARGNCCVWDIRQPRLLRTVACFETPIACVAVSNTTGDWVVATHLPHQPKTGPGDFECAQSRLLLYTVNGVQAANAGCPALVHSLAFSSLMEGRSVNVIAAISDNHPHNVVLYSSWDMVRLHSVNVDTSVIRSLKWSKDSSNLLVCYQDRKCRLYQSRLAAACKVKPASVKIVEAPSDCIRAFK